MGIRYNDILPYYYEKIKDNPQVDLKMLHFFINTGIKDSAYYWSELSKAVELYCELKKTCPELDSLDIGVAFLLVRILILTMTMSIWLKKSCLK